MICQNKWTRYILSGLIVICLVLSIKVPSFAAKAQVKAEVTVSQEFTVKDGKQPSVGTAINYKLTPLESGTPMPKGTNSDGEYHFTLNGTESAIIQMTYKQAGVYCYKVQPIIEKEYEGYTYDKAVYTLNIYVQNGKEGLLTAVIGIDQEKDKRDEILYKFSYAVEDDDNHDSGNIKTGDSANMLLYVITGAVSLLVVLFFIISKRKKQDIIEEDDNEDDIVKDIADNIKEEIDKQEPVE